MLAVPMVLAAAVLAAQPSGASGSIGGCVRDTTGQGLAGATVAAKATGIQRSVVADAAGCYEIKDLPVGAYRVTTRVTGFDNVTIERVAVESARVQRLDVTTRISTICECVRIAGNLADRRERADAVLYVRVTHSEPASTPPGYYRHAVTVLDTVKGVGEPGPRNAPVVVLQNQRSGTHDPFDVGQELVVFLVSSDSNTFLIMNDEPGLAVSSRDDPAMVFLIGAGRVQRGPSGFSQHIGMQVAPLLEELRALRRGR